MKRFRGASGVEWKKKKYLNQFELHTLLKNLTLGDTVSWDWFILLVAKTGMRFSEALALTPEDFDFAHQTISVSKTWNYKDGGGAAYDGRDRLLEGARNIIY